MGLNTSRAEFLQGLRGLRLGAGALIKQSENAAGALVQQDFYFDAAGGGASQPYGLATEIDSAFALVQSGVSQAYGLAVEADSALSVAQLERANFGLSVEADSALTVSQREAADYGLSLESSTALQAVQRESTGYGLATETDSAFALPQGGISQAYGIASETDIAFAALQAESTAYGLATESNIALAASQRESQLIGLATEVDTALTPLRRESAPYGLAIEADTALVLPQAGPSQSYGLAIEIDTAFAASQRESRIAGKRRILLDIRGRIEEFETQADADKYLSDIEPKEAKSIEAKAQRIAKAVVRTGNAFTPAPLQQVRVIQGDESLQALVNMRNALQQSALNDYVATQIKREQLLKAQQDDEDLQAVASLMMMM